METLRDFNLRTYGDKTQLVSRLTIYIIDELEHHGVKTMEPPDQPTREFCNSIFASLQPFCPRTRSSAMAFSVAPP